MHQQLTSFQQELFFISIAEIHNTSWQVYKICIFILCQYKFGVLFLKVSRSLHIKLILRLGVARNIYYYNNYGFFFLLLFHCISFSDWGALSLYLLLANGRLSYLSPTRSRLIKCNFKIVSEWFNNYYLNCVTESGPGTALEFN